MSASPSTLAPTEPVAERFTTTLSITPDPVPAELGATAPVESFAEKNARETKVLVTITGVSIGILLVFFITMMVILSHYGPTTP